MAKIVSHKNILSANELLAKELRCKFDQNGVTVVNIVGSPGSGKTTLIAALIKAAANQLRIGVIEGDLAGTVDADTLARLEIPVVQINTDGACHLDARMISAACSDLPLAEIDLLIVENVGNLVCTANFDIGEHVRVALLSVPEGDDKLIKYPAIFQTVDALVVTKMDLTPYVPFRLELVQQHFAQLRPGAPVFAVVATTSEGIPALFEWLAKQHIARKN